LPEAGRYRQVRSSADEHQPLALGLAGDIYVVMAKIAGSPIAGLVGGVLGLILLIGLWHAYPLTAAYIRNRADR
jgi:hypothetical protein